jgi:hypothetical protein
MKRFILTLAAVALAALDGGPAAAQSVSGISVDGVSAALLMPGGRPRGAIILLAGGDGQIGVGGDGSIARGGNQLVRTRRAYAARGFAVLVPEGNVNVAAAVRLMSKYGPVTLVGTSRGTQRAARGIAAGARPARLVLTAGFLSNASGDGDNVMAIVGSPSTLPPTLVVHHRRDGCRVTRPEGVAPFLKWARGKARVVWLDGGRSSGRACGARAYHGFAGIDGRVVAAVAGFAARR